MELAEFRLETARSLLRDVFQILRRYPWLVLFVAVSEQFLPSAGVTAGWEAWIRYGATLLLTAAIYLHLAETLAAQSRARAESATLQTALGVAGIVTLFEMAPLAFLWSGATGVFSAPLGEIGRHFLVTIVFSAVLALGWSLYGPRAFAQFGDAEARPNLSARFQWLLLVPGGLLMASTVLVWAGEAARAAPVPGFSGDLSFTSVLRILFDSLWGLFSVASVICVAASFAAIVVLMLRFVSGDTTAVDSAHEPIATERQTFSAVLTRLWPIPLLLYALTWPSGQIATVLANWLEWSTQSAAVIIWVVALSLAAAVIAVAARRRLGASVQLDGAAPLFFCCLAIFGGAACAGAWAGDLHADAALRGLRGHYLSTAFAAAVAAMGALLLTALIGPSALRFLAPSRSDAPPRKTSLFAPASVLSRTLALLAVALFALWSGRVMFVVLYELQALPGGATPTLATVLLSLWQSAGGLIGFALYYVAIVYAIVALTFWELEPVETETAKQRGA